MYLPLGKYMVAWFPQGTSPRCTVTRGGGLLRRNRKPFVEIRECIMCCSTRLKQSIASCHQACRIAAQFGPPNLTHCTTMLAIQRVQSRAACRENGEDACRCKPCGSSAESIIARARTLMNDHKIADIDKIGRFHRSCHIVRLPTPAHPM